MMRITFELINYFNFISLNCVLQYTLLKVLSVPLKFLCCYRAIGRIIQNVLIFLLH